MEIGTLKELNVQPGDVVGHQAEAPDITWTCAEICGPNHMWAGQYRLKDSNGRIGIFHGVYDRKWRIISRAEPKGITRSGVTRCLLEQASAALEQFSAAWRALSEPAEPEGITWGEWGRIRVGEEGDVQMWCKGDVTLYRYPAPKQPVVEMVAMFGANYGAWTFDMEQQEGDTHRITFNVIDGKPDWSTLRGEALA